MNLLINELNFSEAVWGFPEVVEIKLHQIPVKQNVLKHIVFIIKELGVTYNMPGLLFILP